MKWQLIFLVFIFYQRYVKAESIPSNRIINGFNAIPKQIPYQVLLQYRSDNGWTPFCGGVIVSNRLIVTAAHCLDQELDSIQIFFGAVDRENAREPGQQRLIVKNTNFFIHPEWEGNQLLNDIALIRLPADLQFDDYIQPAKLPDPNQSYDNESGVVSGWGLTSEKSSEMSKLLLYLNITVMSNEECKPIVIKAYPPFFFRSSWICLKPSESIPFRGDSGGPLAIRSDDGTSTLIGVTSFGITGNFYKAPVIYTRISSFLEWIKQYE